jgi:hypothetical protein
LPAEAIVVAVAAAVADTVPLILFTLQKSPEGLAAKTATMQVDTVPVIKVDITKTVEPATITAIARMA